MIYYTMYCPVHHDNLIKTDKTVKRPGKTKDPIFECKLCKKFYVFDKEKKGAVVGTFGGVEVLATDSVYKVGSDNFDPPSGSVKPTNPLTGSSGFWGEKGSITNNSIEPIVRIKRVKDEEVPKARTNLNNLRNEFPSIITDKMSVYNFMFKVLGQKVERDTVVRNTSLMWKGSLVKKVEFYVRDSSYLSKKIPANVFISFGGKLSNGEFIVDEIRLVSNISLSDGWMRQGLVFVYDGPKNTNWFYGITDKPAEPSKRLSGELASWNEYLNWKRQLAELRIRGYKYIALKIDIEERKMTFLTVTEGNEQFKEFRKYLNRNEISAFSNQYSKNRWYFEFNREYQDTQDSGIDLIFMEYGNKYEGEEELLNSSWESIEIVKKKSKGDDVTLSLKNKVSHIGRNYFNPIFHELVFELTERALMMTKRDIRRTGSLSDASEKSIMGEFFGDGYLATAQIGDFALLSRLQKAIDDLSVGKSAQQSLNKWLFDITRAGTAQEINKIEVWQNKKINESQKKAVEKILAAPDVCLIQGPPGTGKTTVIAEAVYQLVSRNKRVLIASQANLAVDNALERLIKNPKIRAIRLGSAKKIDDSVKNITEENVLETFYNSIVDYNQKVYLNRWKKIDQINENVDKDINSFEDINDQINDKENRIKELFTAISSQQNDLNSEKYISEYKEKQSIKMCLATIRDYCSEKTSDIELILDWNTIIRLWTGISDKLHLLNDKGIYLTNIGIDINESESLSNTVQSNRIIKHVIQRTRRSLNLLDKLSKESEFGGESAELENLKLIESELREKMLSDPTVITQWQEVTLKIKEYNNSGVGLDESELKLFGEKEQNQSREYYKKILAENETTLRDIIEFFIVFSTDEYEKINQEIISLEERNENIVSNIENNKAEIESLNCQLKELKVSKDLILEKYNATDETLVGKTTSYLAEIEEHYKTVLDRDEWEDIFSELKTWVNDIPDYSQEKDIFLKSYINGCNVVGVSCTENARTLTENGFDAFDVVIIDEVSKATPPELLIPMLRGCKIVLVGDHRQLPPLFNEHEKSYEEIAKNHEDKDDLVVPLTMEDFEKYKDMVTASLFERYFQSADESIKETLTIQYRMHSDIMELINHFYDGRLIDGNEDDYTEDTKAHYLNIFSNFGTDMIVPERHAYWFDSSRLAGERVYEFFRDQSHSAENIVEAETIIELLKKIENKYANLDKMKKPVYVGVISFYFNQVSLIRKMIKKESFNAIDVEVNTVDRFQGKEKDIIFVSLVRNVKKPKYSIDSYIAAFQRINVAFSRAKNLLIILGSTDMYADQPVRITDMNNGEEKVIYPYKSILELMNSNGTYFTCDEVIPEDRVDEILLSIEKQGVDD